MSIDTPTVHDASEDYLFTSPGLDSRLNPATHPKGKFSRAVGLDGRWIQEARRFPGYKKITTLPDTIDTGSGGGAEPYAVDWGAITLKFVEPFAIQADIKSDTILRGFVILAEVNDTDSPDDDENWLIAHYQEAGSATWYTEALLQFPAGGEVDVLDVTSDNRKLWVVGHSTASSGTRFNYLIRYDETATAWKSFPMDLLLGTADTEGYTYDTPTVTVGTAGGELESTKNFTTAYRFVAPDQNWFGPVSTFRTKNTGDSGDDEYLYYGNVGNSAGLPRLKDTNKFFTSMKIQIFRSVADAGLALGGETSGLLYLESEVTAVYSAASGKWRASSTDSDTDLANRLYMGLEGSGGLVDTALTSKPSLDVDEVAVLAGMYPALKLIANYEGLMFFVTLPMDNDESPDLDTIRWSSFILDRPNLLPVKNRRPMINLSSEVIDRVESSSFLCFLLNKEVLRIHRSGQNVTFDRIHNRHGIRARYSSVAIGNTLMMATPLGIVMLELTSGEIDIIQPTQHILDSEWKATLGSVSAAYDGRMGAVFFHNADSTKHETLVIWLNSGEPTMLYDAPWTGMRTAPTPTTGSDEGAWAFILSSSAGASAFYLPNEARESGVALTMDGGDATDDYNVQAHTGTTTTALKIDEGAYTVPASLVGFYVWGLTGANKRIRSRITAQASAAGVTTLTISPALAATPTVGDKFALAPVPVLLRLSPLGASEGQSSQPSLLDMSRTKTAQWVQVIAQNWDAVADSGHDLIHASLLDQQLTPLTVDPDRAAYVADVQLSSLIGPTSACLWNSGVVLIPQLEYYPSNLDLRLIGAQVGRSIDAQRMDGV